MADAGLKMLLNKIISDIEKIDTRSYVIVETTARVVTDVENMQSQMNKIVPIVETLQKQSILSSQDITNLKDDVQRLSDKLDLEPSGSFKAKTPDNDLRLIEAETNKTRWTVAAKVTGLFSVGAYVVYRLVEELLST